MEISKMVLERIVVGFLESNCYIFGDEKEVVIIDPGSDYKKINAFIRKSKLTPIAILNTHGHADHIGANRFFNLPVWIHALDADFLVDANKNLSSRYGFVRKSPPAARILKDGDKLKIGNLELEVIHTPGHTPGGISIKCNNIIFTGDTLFRAGVGRTDLPHSSERDLLESITNKLLIYNDASIYPGHGPASTIAWEKANNPFLRDV